MSRRAGPDTSSSPCAGGGLSRMLVPEEATASLEEDQMYPVSSQELATQRIAELHRQAARQRLIRHLKQVREGDGGRRPVWRRRPVRQPRPAGA